MDGFQHEQPDYWLNFGNPWEIERLNVGYPIKFYGHVSVQEEEGRQVFKWNPGESVRCPAPPQVGMSCPRQLCHALSWLLAAFVRLKSTIRGVLALACQHSLKDCGFSAWLFD